KCPSCGKVFCPPRAHCHLCYEPTQWVRLPGTGTVKACTVQHYSTSVFIKKLPFICAYVQLDGSDSLLMINMEVDDVAKIKAGSKVKAAFRENRFGVITDLYFVPAED
ncbi:MAG: OB-fold domain-containing protein, partial [Proteobacteria bacterium]|nr:OB-fold domain-containing protein [Pseudomonadota bacterium]